ncbi:hypothetical protein PG997_010051 [Apiospora hydei]|uniref:Neprosin domain-containing protein n=1 Tax=Apiospora hydei TaxID=1337664 RepID=A0ABR1VVX8_9PEZI
MLYRFSSLALLALGVSALPNPQVEGPPANPHPPPSAPHPNIDAIKAVDPNSFPSYHTGNLSRDNVTSPTPEGPQKRWVCSQSPILTWGDNDNGGKGVTITNADNGGWRGFYIYHNSCDSVPWKYIWIDAGATQFVSLPDGFEGRIQRGVDSTMLSGSPQNLGTWFEISFDGAGVGWGDTSLIRGCDGAALLWSLDGSGAWKGFTQYVLEGAPNGAYDMKNNGQWVIKYTENGDGSVNTIPRDWLISQIGTDLAYVDDYHGNPVIASGNGRFGTYWPAGRP